MVFKPFSVSFWYHLLSTGTLVTKILNLHKVNDRLRQKVGCFPFANQMAGKKSEIFVSVCYVENLSLIYVTYGYIVLRFSVKMKTFQN